MNQTLQYGLSIDRDFAITTLKIAQYFYVSFALVFIHPIAFYLILKKTALLSRELKVCYFLNQVQLSLHDVWGLLMYQLHPLLPYPVMYCSGFACGRWLSAGACLAVEASFTVHSIMLIIATLLFMVQKVLPSNSKLKWSAVGTYSFLAFLYVFLLANVVGCALFAVDAPNREHILRNTPDLTWLSSFSGVLVVFGELRNIGPFRYQVYLILVSILLILPIRLSLVSIAIHTLKKQKKTWQNLTERTQHMQERLVKVLVRQTGMLSIFYIYPQMVIFLLMYVPPDWLPQFLTASIRLLCMPLYTLNSLIQFIILLMTNERFIRDLRGIRKDSSRIEVTRIAHNTTTGRFTMT
ncbi:hypothetical protein PFISCL1PPCAC_1002, partial [Pristionchus fissidentatus]